MDLIELDAEAPGLVAGLADLENASLAIDAPWFHRSTPQKVRNRLRYGFDLEPGRFFVAVQVDRVVASGAVHTSEWDNRDAAVLEVTVHPECRGHGLGSAVHEEMSSVATTMGRTKLFADAWEDGAGTRFAESLGYEARSKEVHRRQHLDEVTPAAVREVHAAATAAGPAYELVRVAGRTPSELLDELADLAAAINDAPLDGLDIEDEVYSAQRVRNYETATLSSGNRLYRVLARHRKTGVLAGHTIVAVEEERPEIAMQHDTAVARDHRGHRLGLRLKSAMNLWLADVEPQLRTIDTWNAESNEHMVAVNEVLGYRRMGRVLAFQRR